MTSSTEEQTNNDKLPPNSNNAVDANNAEQPDEDVVTPWDVVARNSKGVDYDKLISPYFTFNFN